MQVHNVSVLKGFDGILFGTKRKEVNKELLKITGQSPRIFKKSGEINTTDVYENFHIFYDRNNLFAAVGFFGDAQVRIGDQTVLPGDRQTLMNLYDGWIQDDELWVSPSNSIGILEFDGKMEGVLFGKADYYKGLY